MALLKLIVFQVEQGLCVYFRTPDNNGILIDCGNSESGDTPSPVQWLADNEALFISQHKIATLIITHSHDSHIADLDMATKRLSPAEIIRDIDSEWTDCFEDTDVTCYALTPAQAEALDGDMTNNQSIVTVVTYRSGEGYVWKIVIAGDNDSKCLEALLTREEFCDEIKDADFYVTACHGSEEGFSGEIFKAMGKPLANISSTRGDVAVDRRYQKQAQGVKFGDGSTLKSIITREDGNITIEMKDDGRYDVWLYKP